MFKFIKNKKGFILLIFILTVIPLSVVMATGINMQTDWPVSPGGTGLESTSTITNLIQYLYEWGIAIGGLVAFVALLIAGFLYLTSVGDPTKMKDAMIRIKYAFGGLALLLSSWLILHTINPDLTTIVPVDFNIPPPVITLPGDTGVGEVNPCVAMIMFKEPDFEGDFKAFIPGDSLTNDAYGWDCGWIGQVLGDSYVMCRPITCRLRYNNEPIPTINLCPDTDQIAIEVPRSDDLCQKHQGLLGRSDLIEGGDCTLQVFDGAWLGFGCGKSVMELPGPRIPNMKKIFGIDKPIKCLELNNFESNFEPTPVDTSIELNPIGP